MRLQQILTHITHKLFDDGCPYHIETSPLICYDNGLRHERVNDRRKIRDENIFSDNFDEVLKICGK